jgi:hypothetical protein
VIATVYELADLGDEPGALGSPSAPFLVGIGALALMPLPLLLIAWRRYWWLWAALAGAFFGLFGWLMPILAEA